MRKGLWIAALLLAACDSKEQPKAPTEEQSEQLNDAEEMLDSLNEEGAPATADAPR